MPIDPRIPFTSGTPQGAAAKINDLNRRVSMLEASRTILGSNSVGTSIIAPGSIVASHITAGGITASWINAASIGAAVGSFVSINASQITAGDIVAARIQTNVLNALQANVSTLSAITANLGTITAGTITGGVFQTSASSSAARLVADTAGLRLYPAGVGATPNINLNAATGDITATGTFTIKSGSVAPWQSGGWYVGGNNAVQDSSFEERPNGQDLANTWSYVQGGNTFNSPAKFGVSSATAAVSTAQSFHGLKAAALTATSATTIGLNTAPQSVQAVGGLPYTFSFYSRPATTARSIQAQISFRDNTNTQIGSAVVGTSVSEVSSQWTRALVTATAPNGTVSAVLTATVQSAASSEVHYIDALKFEQGDAPTSYNPREDEILANSIQAGQIQASQLSAITADLGTITAGTITAANYQTSDPALALQRVVIDTNGVRLLSSGGSPTTLVNLPTSGVPSFTGGIYASSGVSVDSELNPAWSTTTGVFWRNSTPAVTGHLGVGHYVSGSDFGGNVLLRSFQSSTVQRATAALATYQGTTVQSQLQLLGYGGSGLLPGSVQASALGPSATESRYVIDGNGASDFVQWNALTGSAKSVQMFTQSDTFGDATSRLTFNATINFPVAFSGTPAGIIFMPWSQNFYMAPAVLTSTGCQLNYRWVDGTARTATSVTYSVLVWGPR